MGTVTLLDNVSADTTGTATIRGDGGRVTVVVAADDFGGGTVSLEVRDANDAAARWSTIRDHQGVAAEFTQAGQVTVQLINSLVMRASLAGSTSPSNVYVRAASQ